MQARARQYKTTCWCVVFVGGGGGGSSIVVVEYYYIFIPCLGAQVRAQIDWVAQRGMRMCTRYVSSAPMHTELRL